MFGQYKRIANEFEGRADRQGPGIWRLADAAGGDRLWCCLFRRGHAAHPGTRRSRVRRAVISGSGNVATHAAEKIVHRGGRPLTLSDSGGFIHDPDGHGRGQDGNWVKHWKAKRGHSLDAYAEKYPSRPPGMQASGPGAWPATSPCLAPRRTSSIATMPPRRLLANGCMAVSEGANMPSTDAAIEAIPGSQDCCIAPGKAANAGGVAMSGLEMSQNSARLHRSEEDLRQALRQIMHRHPRRLRQRHGTARGRQASTMSPAPISPASRRWPTRCWHSVSPKSRSEAKLEPRGPAGSDITASACRRSGVDRGSNGFLRDIF